jgi:FMN-dependent NADH-azoreductase
MTADLVHRPRRVLRVDSGADHPNSVTRMLANSLTDRFRDSGCEVHQRAAVENLPIVTGAWVDAVFADGDRAILAMSEVLVEELLAADELIVVAPIYNFGIPAAMKAWIDQVVRADRTFQFTATGPVGMVTAQRAWIITASGSTIVGSDQDFNTSYLNAILGFIGIADVRVIAADGLRFRGEQAINDAMALIAATDI